MIIKYLGPAHIVLQPPWGFYIGKGVLRQHRRVDGTMFEVRNNGYTIQAAMFGYFIRFAWLPFKTTKEIT